MIFARDKAQMCNNLLQYAHVYAWGREHGRKLVSSIATATTRHWSGRCFATSISW